MAYDEIREELKKLWMARAHVLQQVHAGEETFRAMPTWTKAQSLAARRHELHLIELDIVEFDNDLSEKLSRDQKIRKALRELPKAN